MVSTREREQWVFFLQFCDGREERKRGRVREERQERERKRKE
jgi:hypothetical protein